MKKPMHTPGPWEIGDDPCTIYGAADNPLGFIAMTLPDSSLGWNLSEEAEANARLIAATPDLLDALKAAMPVLIEAAEKWDSDCYTNAMLKAQVVLDKLTEEAKGE